MISDVVLFSSSIDRSHSLISVMSSGLTSVHFGLSRKVNNWTNVREVCVCVRGGGGGLLLLLSKIFDIYTEESEYIQAAEGEEELLPSEVRLALLIQPIPALVSLCFSAILTPVSPPLLRLIPMIWGFEVVNIECLSTGRLSC